MGKVLVTDTYLTDIGNAIRSKNGTTDKYKPNQMASAIENIETGGVEPTGEIEITENGTYDVTNYASASVNVSSGGESGGGKYTPRYGTISFNKYTGTELNYEISALDPSYLTSMNSMFSASKSLLKVDLSGWDTPNVTTMTSMFSNSTALTEVIGPNTEANKLTIISSMFSKCTALTKVDFKYFKTNSLTNIGGCFSECTNLEYLDLSGWDTSKTTNIGSLFNFCKKLKFLDIRNFSFDKVTTYTYSFSNMATDCLIIVKDESARSFVINMNSSLTNIKTVAEYEAELEAEQQN